MMTLPPIDQLSHSQAKWLQSEWGGVVVQNPDDEMYWCWIEDPQNDLHIIRPDLAAIPVSVWMMVGFDERRLRELGGDA